MDTTGSDTTAHGEAHEATVMEALASLALRANESKAKSSKKSPYVTYTDDDFAIEDVEDDENEVLDHMEEGNSDLPSVDVLDPVEGAKLPFYQQCRLMKSSRSTAHLRSEGYRPTHIAARLGRVELFWWLVGHEEDTISKTTAGYSIFHVAAEYGCLSLVQGIAERFGRSGLRSPYGIDLFSKTVTKNTALHLAAAHGHLEVVKHLCTEIGLNPRDKNVDLHTPLMLAAQAGHLKVVSFLHSQMRASLVEVGQYKYTALLLAALHGHSTIVDYCLLNGSSPEEKTNLYNTALHVACMGGHITVINNLLSNHPNYFNTATKNSNGQTPLHLAAWAGHSHVVKLLVENYASSLTDANVKGNTPFLMACLRGYLSVAQLLISLGASFNDRNASQNSALLLAAYGGHNDVIEWLLDPATGSGLDLKQTSASGNSPLQHASAQGKYDTVKFLLENYDVDLNHLNNVGRTAFYLATPYPSIAQCLSAAVINKPRSSKNSSTSLSEDEAKPSAD